MSPRTYRRITLLALVLLAVIVVTGGAGLPDGTLAQPVVGHDVRTMGRLLVVAAAVVLFLGTIVTASGPHPGSNGDQVVKRLAFSLHTVARLHGIGVMLFLAMTLATIW